ncbi:hypothetical protein MTR67_044827 [Solanum verrucosum]|uniref:Transmembrane protein n=1 Tax=Solanum verrucosum TaxID=315347 RepID=A0AAF0URX9_SOLVR|nr:hypothetical protein MTR67_044827 [Solanum verrucosum]
MDSFKIKVKKNKVILRYKKRITSLFHFIELCTFFFIISTLLPSARYYFNGRLHITFINPLFVFLLGNGIVVILFLLKSCQSSSKDDSTFLDYNARVIPSSGQVKRKMYRSQSGKLMNKPKNDDRVLRRSATIPCGRYGEKSTKEMTREEFRCTVEAFIARQQRFLREEEFSAVVSIET